MRTLERYLGWAAIPNVNLWIIAIQVCAYVCLRVPMQGLNQEQMLSRLVLSPERVWAGEYWRLASFIFLPPFGIPIFDFFAWWLFYIMGSSLEAYWGTFRYNVYLWLWWLATVATTLLINQAPMTNYGLQQGVFLAFAWLNPEFQLNLFFVLPIQIRYLAALRWLGILWVLISGSGTDKLLTLSGVLNFLVFFAPDVKDWMRGSAKRMSREAARLGHRAPDCFHKCAVCGLTDTAAPSVEFRYCSKCEPPTCYCSDHLRAHTHLIAGIGLGTDSAVGP